MTTALAPKPDRPTRSPGGRRREAVVAPLGLAAGALLLAGCGLVPVEENTFAAAPLPAISQEAAIGVLAAMDRTLTEADAARDPVLLAEVTDAPLLDIASARYALDAVADPEDAEPAPAAGHLDPTVFIPRFEGYPQWFVVAAAAQADSPLRLEVLARDSAAGSWLTLIAPELLPEVEFPVLALDDAGYVVPLSGSDLTDLPADAAGVAAQHATALGAEPVAAPPADPDAAATTPGGTTPAATTPAATTPAATTPDATRPIAPTSTAPATTPAATTPGATTPGATPSAPPTEGSAATELATDPWTVARQESDAAAVEAVGAAATVASTYAVDAIVDQALRTEDGGALVFYTLTGDRTYTVTPTYFLQLDAATAAIVGKPEVTETLTEQWAAQLAVYIPPADDGAARVVAARWDRTGLTGS